MHSKSPISCSILQLGSRFFQRYFCPRVNLEDVLPDSASSWGLAWLVTGAGCCVQLWVRLSLGQPRGQRRIISVLSIWPLGPWVFANLEFDVTVLYKRMRLSAVYFLSAPTIRYLTRIDVWRNAGRRCDTRYSAVAGSRMTKNTTIVEQVLQMWRTSSGSPLRLHMWLYLLYIN